jgi:hypothetical protein
VLRELGLVEQRYQAVCEEAGPWPPGCGPSQSFGAQQPPVCADLCADVRDVPFDGSHRKHQLPSEAGCCRGRCSRSDLYGRAVVVYDDGGMSILKLSVRNWDAYYWLYRSARSLGGVTG